jgi:ADP-dependent NAD(P)H-hydrate dehydratase / NAD(P)H-hydrate epimerase
VIPLLTVAEMRAADAALVQSVGVEALMRAAGERIAAYVRTVATGGRVVAFAGPGNNGGDAREAFKLLDPQFECVLLAAETLPEEAEAALAGAVVVLDALFGTGVRLPVDARYAPAIAAMNASNAMVIAIDIPTGVDADTGAIIEPAVRADATVTLGAIKPGLLLEPGRGCVGALHFADIGIDTAGPHPFATYDRTTFLEALPTRARDAEKRSAGAPLIVAGSEQFPGAAVLCARAAARAGAGYVTVATGTQAAPLVRAHLIEQVVVALPDVDPDKAAGDLFDIGRANGSVAIGPGLGLDDRTGAMLRAFVRKLELPFVLDASGLFHFAKQLDILRDKRCVVTPHAGEFARLSGKGTIAAGTRVERLHEFVLRTGITTLLKGPDTLVFDGTTTYINPTGTNALATAGTGDVLTGIIATLLAQGLDPFQAASVGAYWHGLAGQRAQARRSRGVVAGDLPDVLGEALQ